MNDIGAKKNYQFVRKYFGQNSLQVPLGPCLRRRLTP